MMKTVIATVLRNAVRGLFIGFTVAMVFSLLNGAQYLTPASPDWVTHFTTPLQATLVAALIWMGMGVVFGVGSFVFTELDASVTKKTIIHFIWTFTGFTILAFTAGWDIQGVGGIAIYVVIFIAIYVAMWFVGMRHARKNVDQINAQLKLR